MLETLVSSLNVSHYYKRSLLQVKHIYRDTVYFSFTLLLTNRLDEHSQLVPVLYATKRNQIKHCKIIFYLMPLLMLFDYVCTLKLVNFIKRFIPLWSA